MNADNRRLDWILGGAWLSLLILPWYKVRGGFFGFGWLGDLLSEPDVWPGLVQALVGRWQLWPVILLAAAALWLRLAIQAAFIVNVWWSTRPDPQPAASLAASLAASAPASK